MYELFEKNPGRLPVAVFARFSVANPSPAFVAARAPLPKLAKTREKGAMRASRSLAGHGMIESIRVQQIQLHLDLTGLLFFNHAPNGPDAPWQSPLNAGKRIDICRIRTYEADAI